MNVIEYHTNMESAFARKRQFNRIAPKNTRFMVYKTTESQPRWAVVKQVKRTKRAV